MKIDLSKPPKVSLASSKYWGRGQKNHFRPLIHPLYSVRKRFYLLTLVPLGHARFERARWRFSDEYNHMLRHDIQTIKAWVKLTL